MKKVFTKIAGLSMGLALAVGVGVAFGGRDAKVAKAADDAFMTFDFEDDSAHRTSGNNSYSSTPNQYAQNGVDIILTYADSVTSGTPLSGNANVLGRVAKNTTNSPSLVFGPMDLSSYYVSGFSYVAKTPAAFTVTTSYSTDGTTWTVGETHTDISSQGTFTSSTLDINEPSSFYLKIVVSVESSTKSNRDGQFDDIKIIGHSTSTKQLDYITCDAQSLDVASTLNLASKIQFTPSDAANKNVSFSIKENDENIEMTSAGVITGLKGGSATVTITPEDISGGATPIDVAITVNSIAAPALTIGDQYVIYAVDSDNSYSGELSGVASSLGTVLQMSGETPACEYVLTAEDGYFENTVAFSDGTNYLSLNSAGNNLHTSNTLSANSSWIVSSSDDVTHIINAAFQAREIRFNYNNGNPRFACYTLDGQTAISLYHYEEKSLTDFTIETEIDVYVSATKSIEVTYDPADAADKELTWTTANEGIATVDNDGVVTGVAVGEVIITASKTIGGNLVERTCTVHVLNNVSAHRGTAADPFNVEDAFNVAKGIFVKDPDGNNLSATGTYYVSGLLTKYVNRTKSKLTFWLGDVEGQDTADEGAFEIYQAGKVYGVNLADEYTADKEVVADFPVGAHIVAVGTFTVYNGTAETSNGTADIKYCEYVAARKFAEGFNAAFEAEGVCDADGKDTDVENLAGIWSNQSIAYDALDDDTVAIIAAASPSSADNATAIEKCLAKYDYIGGKYQTQLGAEYDFMGRNPSPVPGGAYYKESITDNNDTIIIVISIAAISALAFTTLLVLKKKKQK